MSAYDERQQNRIRNESKSSGSIGQHRRLMRRRYHAPAVAVGTRNTPPSDRGEGEA